MCRVRPSFRSRHDLSETLRLWLMNSPLRGWEEMTLLSTRSGREALALALTHMTTAGDITRPRAEEVARMVLRDNAVKLYGLPPQTAK